MEELLNMLWAYKTTSRNATGETLYSLSFGTEVVVSMDLGAPSYRTQANLLDNNETDLQAEQNLLEVQRDQAAIRAAAHQQRCMDLALWD